MITAYLLTFCRVVLGFVFTLSVGGKCRDLRGFRQSIINFQLVPTWLSGLMALLCLGGECAVLVGVVVGQELLLPAFALAGMEGDPVTLETYRGRPTFFAFVTPTCAACHDVFPLLHQTAESSAQTVADIVVVSGADQQQTRRIIEEFALTVPVIVAPAETSTFFKDYKITGTPSYCFINEKAIVKEVGHLSPTSLEWKTLVVA